MKVASAVCVCGQKIRAQAADHVSTGTVTCPRCRNKIKVTFTALAGGGGYAAPQPQAVQPDFHDGTILPGDMRKSVQGSRPSPFGTATSGGGQPERDETVIGGSDLSGKRPQLIYRSNPPIALQDGQNIVGRAAADSPANIQIPTHDIYCSRQQLIITVVKMPNGTKRTFIRIYKAKNKTFVNGTILLEGEEVVLKDGDVIRMADTTINYVER